MPNAAPASVNPVVTVDPSGDASRTIFASPKSSTLTSPPGVIFTLAGFKSRWTMPFSCAASSAAAICPAMRRASSNGSGPFGDEPSTSSITR